MAAIVRGGRCAQRNVYITQFFVGGKRSPSGHIADIFRRTFAPRFVARFAFSGENMKGPEQRAAVYVIAPNVLRLGARVESAISITTRGSSSPVAANHDYIIHDKRAGKSKVRRVVQGRAF